MDGIAVLLIHQFVGTHVSIFLLHPQVHFQHTELVQKRNKLEAHQQISAKEAAQRQSSLTTLQGVVQHRRQRLYHLNEENRMVMDPSNNKPTMALFQVELEDKRYSGGRWMKIIQKRTVALEEATTQVETLIGKQQRVQTNYQKLLPADDNTDEVPGAAAASTTAAGTSLGSAESNDTNDETMGLAGTTEAEEKAVVVAASHRSGARGVNMFAFYVLC